jgi:hypothetical protein
VREQEINREREKGDKGKVSKGEKGKERNRN